MRNFIKYNGINLSFTDEGAGIPIVLLHGYLESLDIWSPFSDKLKSGFRVIRIDLPGHGESGIAGDVHTMDMLAETVRFLLTSIGMKKHVLVGHSMGGYVTLAYAEKFQQELYGFSLFHSAPFADTEEKKTNRDREIELVNQGKKDFIINTNIPRGFANDNLEILSDEVERAKKIARKTPEKGITSILEGMKLRPDRSMVIKNAEIPFLWILGKKDNYIAYDVIKKKVQVNDKGRLLVLDNSGHMGFVEEPEKSLNEITSFIKQCAG